MKTIHTFALFAGCNVAAGAFGAESVPLEKIKEKAKTCAACHGEDGNAAASAMYPRPSVMLGTKVFETPIARNAPARPESSPLVMTAPYRIR